MHKTCIQRKTMFWTFLSWSRFWPKLEWSVWAMYAGGHEYQYETWEEKPEFSVWECCQMIFCSFWATNVSIFQNKKNCKCFQGCLYFSVPTRQTSTDATFLIDGRHTQKHNETNIDGLSHTPILYTFESLWNSHVSLLTNFTKDFLSLIDHSSWFLQTYIFDLRWVFR